MTAGPDAQLQRARLVLAFSLALVACGLVFTGVYLLAGSPLAAIGLMIASPMGLASPLVMRLTGSTDAGALWLSTALYGAVTYLAAITGGLYAPVLPWLVSLPVVGTLLIGRRAGFGFAALALATIGVFFALERAGVAVHQELTDSTRAPVTLLGFGVLTVLLLLLALIYEINTDRAIGLISQANQDLAREAREHEQTMARLRRAGELEALGRLAAGIGHEVNNPLTFVIGNLDFADELLGDAEAGRQLSGEDLAELREVMQEARIGADRIGQLVRDIKVFSRFDPDLLEPVDVAQVIRSACKMSHHEIRHRARLELDLPPLPPVMASEGELGQVFLNLLVNAAQAIPVGHAEEHEIRIMAAAAEGRVVIVVSDTGPGMTAEVSARIFEPFFTTKAVGAGTGLGLSICHEIITRLAGTIVVDSAPGAGTRFRIDLPAAAGVVPSPTPPETSRPSLGRRRLLVVDDEPGILNLARRALADHDVTPASSGREAIELCRACDFDLVLCDLMMPDQSGMDVYQALATVRPALRGRLSFMTGGAFTHEMRAFLNEVDRPVLRKPLTAEVLRQFVESAEAS